MNAHYWIAQHVEDLFRGEARNVGVMVAVGDSRCARFFGEDADRQIDGRRLRGLSYPDVYRQWVEFWREEFGRGNSDVARLSGSHYRAVNGGDVTDIAGDGCADVANYLYALLVSEGGLREALRVQEEASEPTTAPLESEVLKSFKALDILGENPAVLVRHPVQRNVRIRGKAIDYSPAFVQDNGHLCVMETVDFTNRQKKASRDHAGWSAYLFKDVTEYNNGTEAIAIVSAREEDLDNPDVEAGLALLQKESKVIRWHDSKERALFLEERRAVAFAA